VGGGGFVADVFHDTDAIGAAFASADAFLAILGEVHDVYELRTLARDIVEDHLFGSREAAVELYQAVRSDRDAQVR
jgi:hypothetical protein